MVKSGEYIQIVKGFYETDKSTADYLLAGSIYGPSYLSFEFALAFCGLIPEAVYTFTSATFEICLKCHIVVCLASFIFDSKRNDLIDFY